MIMKSDRVKQHHHIKIRFYPKIYMELQGIDKIKNIIKGPTEYYSALLQENRILFGKIEDIQNVKQLLKKERI